MSYNMGITLEDRVHILDCQTNVWSVIREIANSGVQEDAFYVCDIGDIVRKHKIWKATMPRVEPYYAVKCNDSVTVLEVLAALGTGFDCASKTEINKVLSLGVDSERIIFANPAKPMSHIRHAAQTGVSIMTFDSEVELHKVKMLYPEAKMVLRIRCDAIESQCPLGIKFGCDPVTEAPNLLALACELGIEVIGVSFHVGSGCREPSAFYRAIGTAKEIFDVAASLGFNCHLLDIGGGYPGDFGTSIEKIAHVVNEALEIFFPDPTIQVIAEPGRFYVSSAYTLACSIHSIRNVKTESAHNHKMYFINDGVYGSFNCILYDHQHVVPQPLKEYPNAKNFNSSIWGPTCDGLDQVVQNIVLPEMELGDWVIFENMGAYTLPVASPFNGFPVPKVHVIANENVWLMLKDVLPLTQEHFVFDSYIGNGRQIIDNKEHDNWTIPTLQHCGTETIIDEHVLDIVDICTPN